VYARKTQLRCEGLARVFEYPGRGDLSGALHRPTSYYELRELLSYLPFFYPPLGTEPEASLCVGALETGWSRAAVHVSRK